VAEFDMMHADGISLEGDIIDMAVTAKLIEKSGTWMRFGDTHLGQGRERARQFLKDNPEMAREIRDKVMAHHKPAEPEAEAEEADDNNSEEPAAE
jgi:recombination protein RecA